MRKLLFPIGILVLFLLGLFSAMDSSKGASSVKAKAAKEYVVVSKEVK